MSKVSMNKLNSKTLKALAGLICGDKSEHYRTGSELADFFQDAGLECPPHDGSTRFWWALGRLEEYNKEPGQLLKVILYLANPKEYLGNTEVLYKVIAQLNEIIALEGLQVKLEGITPHIITVEPAVQPVKTAGLRITDITRLDLIDELLTKGPIAGWSEVGIIAFLRRVWPSLDDADIREIERKVVTFSDWDESYLFLNHLKLLQVSDEQFLRFLERVVHPTIRIGEEQEQYVSDINKHLIKDGFKLQAYSEISGYPAYRAVGIIAGVRENVKNLIFAANGPKPEIVLSDSLSNDITIVRNSEYCLVYDLPIPQTGLLWSTLLSWWAAREGVSTPTLEIERSLYRRLKQSLDSPPEKLVFDTYYGSLRPELGDSLPALIPQVYLHYDPYTIRFLNGTQRLPRQRMDFLILFSNHERVVIEVDGKQHYADGEIASPQKYGEMMSTDRQLRLAGYEVYRLGGYELQDKVAGGTLIAAFFRQLLQKHGSLVKV